jgi:hypothetical protein
MTGPPDYIHASIELSTRKIVFPLMSWNKNKCLQCFWPDLWCR